PRFGSRHRHRRGHQGRQSRPDRPRRRYRPALPDWRPGRNRTWRHGGRLCHNRPSGRRDRECDDRRRRDHCRAKQRARRYSRPRRRQVGRGRAMNTATSTETVEAAQIGEILRLLPHRYPFVMIDRVVDIRGDDAGVGIKNVTINEPQFLGHFPDNPVMPGVLLIEGMAQTAGILVLRRTPLVEARAVYLLTIDKAKFRRPAVPGDRVEYHVKKSMQRRNMWWYSAEAKVDGALIAEAVVGALLGEAAS